MHHQKCIKKSCNRPLELIERSSLITAIQNEGLNILDRYLQTNKTWAPPFNSEYIADHRIVQFNWLEIFLAIFWDQEIYQASGLSRKVVYHQEFLSGLFHSKN